MSRDSKNKSQRPPSAGFALDGKRRRSVLSMAPLIDFTFILLIFFMVVTKFDHFTPVDVNMKKSRMKAAIWSPPKIKADNKPLRLVIRADGTFVLDGREIGLIDNFTGVLAHHQVLEKDVSTTKPLLFVMPEDEVSVQLLIDALNALKAVPGFVVRIVMNPAKPETGTPLSVPVTESKQK